MIKNFLPWKTIEEKRNESDRIGNEVENVVVELNKAVNTIKNDP